MESALQLRLIEPEAHLQAEGRDSAILLVFKVLEIQDKRSPEETRAIREDLRGDKQRKRGAIHPRNEGGL